MIVVGLFLGGFVVAGVAIALGNRWLYRDLPPRTDQPARDRVLS